MLAFVCFAFNNISISNEYRIGAGHRLGVKGQPLAPLWQLVIFIGLWLLAVMTWGNRGALMSKLIEWGSRS